MYVAALYYIHFQQKTGTRARSGFAVGNPRNFTMNTTQHNPTRSDAQSIALLLSNDTNPVEYKVTVVLTQKTIAKVAVFAESPEEAAEKAHYFFPEDIMSWCPQPERRFIISAKPLTEGQDHD